MLPKQPKFELTTFWTDDADFYIYADTTADGYEVYVATHDPSNITITEDVYYYDGDLEDVLYKALKHGYKIYVDDLESHWAMGALDKFNKDER